MSKQKNFQPRYRFLKSCLTAVLFSIMFGFAFASQVFCQQPGFGERPDQWAPYESGKYLDRLHEIEKIYHLSDSQIDYLHFTDPMDRDGPVELFRIYRGAECSEGSCYFVLISAEFEAPFMTPCQLTRSAVGHLYNPDRSKFMGFEFVCRAGVIHVKVAPTHFMVMPVQKSN